jgi:S-adenosylmethionine:tRNA ribosyltransferase-isomerase
MKPATSSFRNHGDTKVLIFNEDKKIIHSQVRHLDQILDRGDVLVVNHSATLPSSFFGFVERTKEKIEIRLAAFQGPHPNDLSNWWAFSFGEGDWHTPTEKRGAPPELKSGDRIILREDFWIEVRRVRESRLLDIHFECQHLEKLLYEFGRPIQYSYLTEELKIWDQQTVFAGPPISVEPPSAAFPFTWDLLLRLKNKGVEIVPLLHSAGISSTGSEVLDQLLPLSEWYEIPMETAYRINQAKHNKRRVIALGTTVLRALETSVLKGFVLPGSGLTNLRITPQHNIQSVTGLITGMHELGTSHRDILHAFCPEDVVEHAYQEAEAQAYRSHEYGDISLIL